MSHRVPVNPPRSPDIRGCRLGSPVRPETMRQFADALVHYVAARCPRVTQHVIGYPASPVLRITAPAGAQTIKTRLRTGPLPGQVVIGIRYQASRPKDGSADQQIDVSLVRVSDDEEIDATSFGPADLIADPTESPSYLPRWAFTPLAPVGGPRPLVVPSDDILTDVELELTCEDVRVLTVVVFEVPPREVG